SQCLSGIATDHQRTRLGHETTHVSHITLDDDFSTFQGNTAAGAGVTLDHQQATMGRGTRRLGSITPDAYRARHHVFRHTLSGAAIDGYVGFLVHAGTVVAHMTFDVDTDLLVKTAGNVVLAFGINNAPLAFAAGLCLIMQRLVQLPDSAC